MARSATLDPTSMPFRPAGGIAPEDGGFGLGFRPSQSPARARDQEGSTVSLSNSSLSIGSSDYRSTTSSPGLLAEDVAHGFARQRSAQQFGGHTPEALGRQSPYMQSHDSNTPPAGLHPRSSPAIRQVEADRPYPGVEGHHNGRESSLSGSLDSLPEDGPETPGPTVTSRMGPLGNGLHKTGSFSSGILTQTRDHRLGTPPIAPSTSSRSSSFNVPHPGPMPFISSSPASSIDSITQFASAADHSGGLDTQLKMSPFIHDLLDRLIRCEIVTREIQRDLQDVNSKVDILLERSTGSAGAPEFNNPFASSSAITTPSLSRGSLSGNIAPNQAAPPDEVGQIAQRLNTLTSSVGQLLALQTRQHLQNGNSPLDVGPNQPVPNAALLGHGLPSRPDLRGVRAPLGPTRTWSAGSLDIPNRAPDALLGGRQDMLRDKQRRSVMGIMRRESAGSENWGGGGQRDNGATLTKWDQLNLVPDLLRSLTKFGVGPPNKIQQRALPFLLRGSDIIAQAPPTQERIAAYVIPAIQVVLTNERNGNRGPMAVMISTTVDQATQAQRMIRDLGGPIGVRSALGVGATSSNSDLGPELRLLQQNMPHIICGTPQKLHALFTAPGGLVGSDVRFLVLDEVDQLIARNLHDFVFSIVKLLPPPRSRAATASAPGSSTMSLPQFPAFDINAPGGLGSPFQNPSRKPSGVGPSLGGDPVNDGSPSPIERQSALFSNTVPQDVLNLAQAINLREPVRVLVRRDGNVTHSDTTQGARGLRQFYLYLAFTAGGRADPASLGSSTTGGLGIIGSGRGTTSAETTQARQWKLDALLDLFEDIDTTHAIVHVGGLTALDNVVYKLASRGYEAVPLHGDMSPANKLAAINKFRSNPAVAMRQPTTKALVVYDVQVKSAEVSQVPLVVNYDLPKAVEEYAHRVAPAIANNYSRAGIVVNFVTATGGDVEMLRSIECFYKIKCPEVPMTLRDVA